MKEVEALFIELIQVALGNRNILSRCPSDDEWKALLTIAKKQAVVGITFDVLDGLSQQKQKVPSNVLFEWIGLTAHIKRQNHVVNQRCGDITKFFAKAGFATCILKGQGNARMYPNSLSRTSGDIDIWVDGSRNSIKSFVIAKCPSAQDGNMHIEFPIFRDVAVEVHYKPSYDVRPKYEKRLQLWFSGHLDEQIANNVNLDGEQVCFPTIGFNVIHQMSHIMNHFFVEGIGMRHFVDYYYVLKKFRDERIESRDNGESVGDDLIFLGLQKFAKGVMWIEKNVLGIDEQCLIVDPDERIGKLILKEMMEGGNFGHHDERYKGRNKGLLTRGITDTYRLMKMLSYFPDLVLWKIWNKVENQRWKVRKFC